MFAVLLTKEEIQELHREAVYQKNAVKIAYFGSILSVIDAEELREFDRKQEEDL